ncbi:hypothetical protein FE257_008533 [Aspergillus nanangensis]|uniref:Uncharacterized protein n=1 Tax=Aspergillus nanangensis TaxID=2582783 RepID=A0AAD4CLF8_ASPNN|nr:hypothetical protein FE257_008533 [Aspergillus nanangensis]
MFGKYISLLPLALASCSISAPLAHKDKAPSSNGPPETIYLSNCNVHNSIMRSAMFYYPAGAESVHGELPESGNHAGIAGDTIVTWEGNFIRGVFGSGVVFTSQITAGPHLPLNHSGDGFTYTRNFNCYRDYDRVLFTAPHWGTCYSIYYCQ